METILHLGLNDVRSRPPRQIEPSLPGILPASSICTQRLFDLRAGVELTWRSTPRCGVEPTSTSGQSARPCRPFMAHVPLSRAAGFPSARSTIGGRHPACRELEHSGRRYRKRTTSPTAGARGQRGGDGVRNLGRYSGTGVAFIRDPSPESSTLRRVPQRPGRTSSPQPDAAPDRHAQVAPAAS